MPDTNSVQKNIGIVRALSNETAAFLHTLPDDVWRDPDRFASGCENWKVGDVIAHLIDQANHTTLSIERALRGSAAPPLGHRPLTPDEANQQLIELRAAFDEDLFPEFNASCLRLNRLLVGLEPDQYDLDAWHASGVRSVARLIEYRALELAVHGWDVGYAFDRDASLSPSACILVRQSIASPTVTRSSRTCSPRCRMSLSRVCLIRSRLVGLRSCLRAAR